MKVIVHDGIYRLEDTLDFLPEDSGTPGNPVVYEAIRGDKAHIMPQAPERA